MNSKRRANGIRRTTIGPLPEITAAGLATLEERVGNLYDDIVHFDASLGSLEKKIDATYIALSNKVDSAITSINAKLDERSRIQWPAWAVAVSVVIAVGTLVYWPIKDQINDLHVGQERNITTLRDMQKDSYQHLVDLQKSVVPRGEHEEKWRSFDAQHADLKAAVATGDLSLQRQIDDLNRRMADTYNARDALLYDRQRIDALSVEINKLLAKSSRSND